MSDEPHEESDATQVNKHIQVLIGAHVPDDSEAALTMRKLVGKFAHMYFHIRLPELAERTQATEELLAEVAFWWAMHQVEANTRFGKPLPGPPSPTNKLY